MPTDEASARRDLRAESVSIEHLATHSPKNPYCDYCQRAKMPRVHCRVKHGTGGPVPENFGDSVTADHVILNDEESVGIGGMRYLLVIYDRATRWVDAYPLVTKSADDAYACFVDFAGPSRRLGYVWSDNSQELVKALRDFVTHGRSTPYRAETNGIAERMNRTVLEGSRTSLLSAGLPPVFWPLAVKCFCFARNILNTSQGVSAWEGRHEKGIFSGLLVPFGSLVDFLPTPPIRREQAKMAPNALPGIFLGYWQNPGGRGNGEYLAADIEDVCQFIAGGCDLSASPRVHRVKELIKGSKDGVIFPLRNWYAQRTRIAQERGV